MANPTYPQITITPNLGLNLTGMDVIIAQDFLILDTFLGGFSGIPGGTTGQVQFNNGGAFGGIAEGTAGQVLTSNGLGVAPSFQASGGGGTTVQINGSPITNPNFNNTTPAAPGGFTNVIWQVSGSNISAYVPVTSSISVVIKSSSYAAVAGNVVLCDTSGGGFTVTLPLASANPNTEITVKKRSSDGNVLLVSRSGADLLDDSITLPIIAQYTSVTLVSDGISNWNII